jgi:hypothetical protein
MKVQLKQKIIIVTLLLTVILGVSTPNDTYQASGADGSAGTLAFGFNEYIPGDSYLILMTDLTVSGAYTLDFTAGCADQYNFTTGAAETAVSHRVTLEAPTTGSECIITLESQSDGVTIDSIRLQSTTIADIVNQGNLIEIIMLVVVILVLLSVAVAIFKRAT